MVNSPSPATQSADAEKKRKQTLERAKANHLSRQLQLRLQYAKLKVEHGWQKQTLNEVENLYFRHSHLHGHKIQPSTSTLVTTTQNRGDNATGASQSSLSFKLGGSSFSINTLRNEDTQMLDQSTSTGAVSQSNGSTAIPLVRSSSADSQQSTTIPESTSTTSKTILKPHPTELISSQSQSYPPAPWPSPPLTNNVPLPSSSLYYRNTTSTIASSSPGKGSSESLTRFSTSSSSSSLTYDSFWSSHSNSQFRTNGLSSVSSSGLLSSGVSATDGLSAQPPTSTSTDTNGRQTLMTAAKITQGGYRRGKGSRYPQDKES